MHLVDIFFPKFCVGCGKIGKYICFSCRKTIDPIQIRDTICPVCEKGAIDGGTHPRCRTQYGLDGFTSFFHYRGVIKKLIKAIKYRFQSDISKTLPLIIHEVPADTFLASQLTTNISIVPIPLHVKRLRFRGFNQANEIGKILAKNYKIPFQHDMIQRIKNTVPQVEMKNREERLKNMKEVFSISSNMNMPKNILLVDDVFTTGTTMREACGTLKRGGVEFVWGLTLAR